MHSNIDNDDEFGGASALSILAAPWRNFLNRCAKQCPPFSDLVNRIGVERGGVPVIMCSSARVCPMTSGMCGARTPW